MVPNTPDMYDRMTANQVEGDRILPNEIERIEETLKFSDKPVLCMAIIVVLGR